MTPYGKHTIRPHRSSPSKFRWSNTNLLSVSMHCNAQGGQGAVRSGSGEIPASKVPLSPSFWCVLLPSGSRASDQLIFAKSSDLSRLPCCHCPCRQIHSLHLYIFPDHGSNYLQVQNKRSRRQLHFAAAEKKKTKNPQPLFSQLRRGNTSFSFSRRAPPAPTDLLTIHHWAKAVPSSRETLSNSPHSQLYISLIIS